MACILECTFFLAGNPNKSSFVRYVYFSHDLQTCHNLPQSRLYLLPIRAYETGATSIVINFPSRCNLLIALGNFCLPGGCKMKNELCDVLRGSDRNAGKCPTTKKSNPYNRGWPDENVNIFTINSVTSWPLFDWSPLITIHKKTHGVTNVIESLHHRVGSVWTQGLSTIIQSNERDEN